MSEGVAPPGWQPDPAGGGGLRWWDGERWTDQVAPAPAPASPTPEPAPEMVAPAADPAAGSETATPTPEPAPRTVAPAADPAAGSETTAAAEVPETGGEAGIGSFSAETAQDLADHLVGRWRLDRFPAALSDPREMQVVGLVAVHRAAARHALAALAELLRPGETVVFLSGDPTFEVADGVGFVAAAITDRRAVVALSRVHAGTQPWRTTREFDECPLDKVAVDHKQLLGTEALRLRWKPGGQFELSSRDAAAVERVKAHLTEPGTDPFPELAELLALPRLDPALPAPDWYPDPPSGGAAGFRFWDGHAWLDRVEPEGARQYPAPA